MKCVTIQQRTFENWDGQASATQEPHSGPEGLQDSPWRLLHHHHMPVRTGRWRPNPWCYCSGSRGLLSPSRKGRDWRWSPRRQSQEGSHRIARWRRRRQILVQAVARPPSEMGVLPCDTWAPGNGYSPTLCPRGDPGCGRIGVRVEGFGGGVSISPSQLAPPLLIEGCEF